MTMRMKGILRYQWVATRFSTALFFAILTGILSINFVAALSDLFSLSSGAGPFTGMNIVNQAMFISQTIEGSAISACFFYISIFAMFAPGSSLRFLVPMSVTRKEVLTGQTISLLLQCIVVIFGCYLLGTVTRGILYALFLKGSSTYPLTWVFGGTGWTLAERFLLSMAYLFGVAGPMMLTGALFTRWKKPLFILIGVGFVVLIILVNRISLRFDLSEFDWKGLYETLGRIASSIRDFYIGGGLGLILVKQLLIYLACMVLSYPVMRWTKVSGNA